MELKTFGEKVAEVEILKKQVAYLNKAKISLEDQIRYYKRLWNEETQLVELMQKDKDYMDLKLMEAEKYLKVAELHKPYKEFILNQIKKARARGMTIQVNDTKKLDRWFSNLCFREKLKILDKNNIDDWFELKLEEKEFVYDEETNHEIDR